MREIRRLTQEHIDAYAEIAYNAYPSFKDFSEEAMGRYKRTAVDILENDPDVTFYGLFDGKKLVAVMRLFDFRMNCFGTIIPVSGLGFLGVHLMHKKEKAAKAMVTFYEELYREKGLPIGTLLPFRPDFYKKMGYGIGTKMNQYRIETGRIPAYFGKSDLRYVGKAELEQTFACHARVTAKTHGMMMKFGDEIRNMKQEEFDRIVGSYDEAGNMTGYLVWRFENGRAGNYTQNNVFVKELIYEDTETLRKLLGFLRKQEDQVQLTIFNTEDEAFHYLFDNPINDSMRYIPFGYIESNIQAVGVMYKLFDIPKAFRQCEHRNYNNADITICFRIRNELYDTQSDTTVRFKGGAAEVIGFQGGTVNEVSMNHNTAPNVTLSANTAEFSALFLGSVSVRGLYDLGLIELDHPELLTEVDRTFYCPQKPVCYTDF